MGSRDRKPVVTVARLVLGTTFVVMALNYFFRILLHAHLLPIPVTDQGKQFAQNLQAIGFIWPFMKAVNLAAGSMLVANRAPAFALALLLPATVMIVWFHIKLDPLPLPLLVTGVIVVCELVLLTAYWPRFAPMLGSK
jgi:hypothetical protein